MDNREALRGHISFERFLDQFLLFDQSDKRPHGGNALESKI